jgi:hypothetical protein
VRPKEVEVAERQVQGRKAIREMFANGFAITKMICIVENLFEDGEWAILECRDPQSVRGCGFFHVVEASCRPRRRPSSSSAGTTSTTTK